MIKAHLNALLLKGFTNGITLIYGYPYAPTSCHTECMPNTHTAGIQASYIFVTFIPFCSFYTIYEILFSMLVFYKIISYIFLSRITPFFLREQMPAGYISMWLSLSKPAFTIAGKLRLWLPVLLMGIHKGAKPGRFISKSFTR